MSLTNQQLTERIEALETALDTIQVAINNLATKQQVKSLALLQRAEEDTSDFETRVSNIETLLNDIQTALNALATKAQLKQLVNIRLSEIEQIKERITTLETEVAALQA